MSKKLICVFGATGQQGGSVLKSLINSNNYIVKAITRKANSDKALALAKIENVIVQEADVNNRASLDKVLEGCYGVFLVTDTQLDHGSNQEELQGINVIDSAVKNNVSHLVFSGLENVKSVTGKECTHFDNKEKIEQYGMKFQEKLNFTSVRMSAFHQILPNTLLQKTSENQYAITLPMSDKPIYLINVNDIGNVVRTVFDKPNEFKSRIVGIAGDYLTGPEIAEVMNQNLQPNKFFYANISLETFLSWGFPGVEDLTYMFEYYQTGKMQRDLKLTKELNPEALTFNEWIIKNKEEILKNLPN